MYKIRVIYLIILIAVILTSCNTEKEYMDEWSEEYRENFIENHMEEKYGEDFTVVNFSRGGVDSDVDYVEILVENREDLYEGLTFENQLNLENYKYIKAYVNEFEDCKIEDNYFNHIMIKPYSEYIEGLISPLFNKVKYEYNISLYETTEAGTREKPINELKGTGFKARVIMIIPESELDNRSMEDILDEIGKIMVKETDSYLDLSLKVSYNEAFDVATSSPGGEYTGKDWFDLFPDDTTNFINIQYGEVVSY